MRKDPTEFRKRFAAWKDGKKPYKDGKPLSDEEYVRIMENVAANNWQQWGEDSEDAALTRILNDNSYNYRGYYNKYPNGKGNAIDHWTDEFKTVWHPSFSTESRYSGKKSQYNPHGLPGGTWLGEFFTPQWYLQNPNAFGFYKDGYPRLPMYKNGKLPYKDGKPVVLNNYTNAKFNDDGTFTDDTTRVFDDFYVTPSGVKTKYGSYTDKNWDRYKQQESFFRTHDQQTGNLKYEPGLEIVSPEYDLLTGIRGIYQTLKPTSKLLLKSLNDVNNISDIAKEPYMKTSADIAKESSTIRELNRINKMLREFSDNDSRISDAYNNIKTFLQSPAYKKRLEKYYRDKGSSIITQKVAPGDRIGELLYNIETSKLKIMPRGKLVDEVGDVKDSFGLYDPNSHSIQIASDAISRLTPEHEMWHASRNARTYLDNEKYKMRVRSLSDPIYYGDMSELEVRVLDTLREMQESGLDINNLTDDQIWNFLNDTPIDAHGTNVQSLIDNYWYDDIKNALRNFKTVIYPLGFGGVGYGSYNKYAE